MISEHGLRRPDHEEGVDPSLLKTIPSAENTTPCHVHCRELKQTPKMDPGLLMDGGFVPCQLQLIQARTPSKL